MEVSSEVWGEGIGIIVYQKTGTVRMRWKKPQTTAVDDVPSGCSSSHLNLMTPTTTGHGTVLNDLFQDCEQKVSLNDSDHKIFLMYILNGVRHEIVLKLIFHYMGNI